MSQGSETVVSWWTSWVTARQGLADKNILQASISEKILKHMAFIFESK